MKWYSWVGLIVAVLALLIIVIPDGEKEPTIITSVEPSVPSSVNPTPQKILASTTSNGGVNLIGEDFNVTNNTAWVNDSKVFISASPHTGLGWINFKINSKVYEGDIDIVLGFNTEFVKPRKAEWTPRNVTVQKSYTCDYEMNYTLTPEKRFWCYRNVSTNFNNGTTNPEQGIIMLMDHRFDSGNLPAKTAFWTEEEEVWTDISGTFQSTYRNYKDMNKWYYRQNIPIEKDRDYRFRVFLQPENFTSGGYKYWFAIKPSGETINEAINNGHLYALDPWTSDLSDGLIAYYSADETSGTNIQDNVTMTRNMTNYQGTMTGGDGILGNGLDLDGTTEIAFINDTTTFTTDMSMQFWIYKLDTSGGTLISKKGGSNVLQFESYEDRMYTTLYTSTGTKVCQTEKVFYPKSTWMHFVYTFDGSNIKIYKDGALNTTCAATGTINEDATAFRIGRATAGAYWEGGLDEIAIWNETLDAGQISSLYNSGSGIPYSVASPITNPSVVLQSPIEDYNASATPVTFIANITDDIKVQNVSLYIDGVLDQTNTSGYNGTYSFSKSVVNGDYNWSILAYNNNSLSNQSETRNFSVELLIPLVITNLDPSTNNSVINGNSPPITLQWKVESFNYKQIISSTSTIIGGGSYGYTDPPTSLNGTTLTDDRSFSDGDKVWYIEAENNASDEANLTIFFTVDNTAPSITVTSPINETRLGKEHEALFLNWSVSDLHLDTCWYDYNNTNTTVTCMDNTTNINLEYPDYDLTFYANDTVGNLGYTNHYWDNLLFQETEFHETEVIEGSSSVFNITVVTNGSTITTASLVYNGTSYGTTLAKSGNNYTISKTLNIPGVDMDSNVSFYWSIKQQGDFITNTSDIYQSVITFALNSCTPTVNYTLYNFTVVNEESEVKLVGDVANVTGDLDLQLYSSNREVLLEDQSFNFSGVNPFAICMDTDLSGGGAFSLDLQLQYDADGFAPEFYNLQKEAITVDDFWSNVTLYDLDDDDAQEFQITYKDSTFLPVKEALVQVQRKYISQGLFKTVEIPMTDINGQTLAHLVLSDVIYTFNVFKDGVLLGTFDNVIAVCDNVALGDCSINLNAFSTTIPLEDFNTVGNFVYALSFDDTTGDVEATFSVPSGALSTVVLNVTQFSGNGATSVCTDSLETSSGTVSCTAPSSFENTTLIISLTQDGEQVGYSILPWQPSSSELYGANQFIMGMIMVLMLVGMGISGTPILVGIFLILGMLMALALNLFSGGSTFAAGATIFWSIIAVLVVIIKGVKRQ